MKRFWWIFFIAFAFRASIAILGWSDIFFRSPEKSIFIVFERSAYLMDFGYGYSQVIPGSDTYQLLESKIDSINSFKRVEKDLGEVSSIYPTQHYPPGFSTVGAVLFSMFNIPVRYSLQSFGILIDLIGLYYLLLLCRRFFSDKKYMVIGGLMYSLYPPIAYASVALMPDSILLSIVLIISYLFIKYFDHEDYRYLLLIGVLNGVGAMFRSDLILFPFFLFIMFLMKYSFRKVLGKSILYGLTVGVLTFMVLLPWGIRNVNVNSHFNITSTALGGTLVTGLGTFPNPWGLGATDIDRQKDAKEVGIMTPFEANGDRFFRNKFLTYIKQKPDYYAKVLILRSMFFIAAPYYWGNEKKNRTVAFSTLRQEGKILQSVPYVVSVFWGELLSASLSFVSFLLLLWTFYKVRINLVTGFIGVNYFHVYLTHIPIHTATNYVYPIIFCNILILLYVYKLIAEKKDLPKTHV